MKTQDEQNTISAWDLIKELILQTPVDGKGAVGFGQRNGERGYTKVFGPTASLGDVKGSHISIEHRYPAVRLSEDLAPAFPLRTPCKDGVFSGGPNPGIFREELCLDTEEVREAYPDAKKLAEALIRGAKQLNLW